MTKFFTKVSLALALGATALTAAAPADAQRYGGHRGNDGTGTAIIAGIAGLAIGAAIASSSHRNRGYEQGYYDQQGGYYEQQGGYYADRGYDYADRGYDQDRRYEHGRRHHHRDDRGYNNGYDRNNGYAQGYGY